MPESSSSNRSELEARARAYWSIDGIPLLAGALVYMATVGLAALMLYLLVHEFFWPGGELLKAMSGLAFITSPFLMIGLLIWLTGNWEDLVEWFKIRLTYPRTGYVAPPSQWTMEDEIPEMPRVERTPVERWLTILGSFLGFLVFGIVINTVGKFWNWKLKPGETLVLLLTIRGLRYGLYSTASQPGQTNLIKAKLQIAWQVLNSLWVWLMLPNLFMRWSSPARPWSNLVFALILTGIATRFFAPELYTSSLGKWAALSLACFSAGVLVFSVAHNILVAAFAATFIFTLFQICRTRSLGSFKVLGGALCAFACFWLLRRETGNSILLAFLLPGICAAMLGAARLVRFLRANPLPAS